MLKNKEIAEILNISPSAVSFAINNKSGVSEETRRKVLALKNTSIVAELNRVPNSNFQNGLLLFVVLKKHGNVIGNTPFFLTLSEALHQQSYLEGFGLQVIYCQPNENFDNIMSKYVSTNQYSGIILLATEASNKDILCMHSYNIPFIVIDGWFAKNKADCVLMDNWDGVIQATEYLFRMGHRDIGFIRSNVQCNNLEERHLAFQTGMSVLGLQIHDEYIFTVSTTIKRAADDMDLILKKSPKLPTAFICGNDIMAMGVIEALKKNGFRVPEDMSIIGFDDMPISAHYQPPLTTIHIHNRSIAKLAVEILASKINGKSRKNSTLRCLIGVELVIRESVKKIEI